jgi:ribonuclease R
MAPPRAADAAETILPRRSKSPSGDTALPSREAILAFIRDATTKVGKREIARAFGVAGDDRPALKKMLRELEEEGVLDRRGRTLNGAGQLPSVVLADIVRRDRDGELVAEPVERNGQDGAKPARIVIAPRRFKQGERPAGIGDRALIRVERRPGEDGAYAGRIVKVLPRERSELLGIYRAVPGAGGRLVPVDKKSHGREVLIAPGDENGAEDGDLISATPTNRNRFGLAQAKVRERLGSVKSEKAVSLVAIYAHSIRNEFSPEVLGEAEKAKPATLKGREDWRDLPLVTIDPPDAKDHDDAVHAVPDTDPGNPDGHVVTVAIADVAAYVRPGSALDREALERGNSVYFPDRVVPMLPERISNDLCSLVPHQPRPALAVRMIIGADGRKKSHSFHRVMMRSAAKLSYQQAQDAIDGRPDDTTGPILDTLLRPLWAAYGCVARERDRRGPLSLDLPERKIVLKPDGMVDRIFVPERLEAHRLIEEFMILANVAAAETLEKAGSPLVYRVHDEPSLEKMRSLSEVLASVGYKLPKDGALRPALFNRILAGFQGSEHQIFINEVVLRSQAQAVYAADNAGHFGLNLRRYAHFTSPIRRYADLIVHRSLIRALRAGDDGLPADMDRKELIDISERISAAERRAMAAERETVERLIAFHLADRVGATFTGRISGVTRSGLFVKLADTGADGFVPAATIGADYYRHDEARHALVGERTGETYRLGDPVEVKLVEAAPVAGALRFELLTEGRPGERSSRSRSPFRNRAERAGARRAEAAPARGNSRNGR